MTPDPPQLKAHQISDSRSGTAYFVLVKLKEDPNDFEASKIDVRVTDGRCCWSMEGLLSQPAPKAWMRNVYNALSGSSKDSYEIQVQSSTDELKVIFRWHEAGIRVRASIALPAATNEDELPSMLNTLFQSFAAMQEAYAELAQLEAGFRSRADSSQAALEKLVESKERREQELYIKFAAVVNEKKQKLRELQQRVQELENQAEESPDLDNGSGAGSPPRGQADADYDSIYDADTAPSAPSAEDSAAGSDLQNEATQPRPAAGTFGLDTADMKSMGNTVQDSARHAHVSRTQAEREALLAAETQATEPEEEDEEMLEAPAEAAPAQQEPAPLSRPTSKPGGLAKRRRR